MGTTVSIEVRDPAIGADRLDAAVAILREHEARFSPFLPDSEIRRLERGEIGIEDAHPDVREVLDACAVIGVESDGAFDAWREGRLDPSGYVKGWAAERAADVLREAGARSFALNLGGDIVSGVGHARRVARRDIPDRTLMCQVSPAPGRRLPFAIAALP